MGTKKYLYDLSLDLLFKRLDQIKHYRGYEIPIYLVVSKKSVIYEFLELMYNSTREQIKKFPSLVKII